MTSKTLDSIAEQIAAARKSITGRPEWMKSVAHFSEPRIESQNSKESPVVTLKVNTRKTSAGR